MPKKLYLENISSCHIYYRSIGILCVDLNIKNLLIYFKSIFFLSRSSPAPKIVFNRLNGKKYHNTPAALLQVDPQPNEGFTSAHQENVKFIYEAWQEVVQLAEEGGASDETGSASAQGPVQYSDTNPSPNPALKNFVPIDLDEWWAQRFLANIDNLS
uniref:MAPK regulated corepressor interacting protein 2 n=1 Tax=Oncorhynchus tshawytscha TaxID=74940 RepID=A0AAZ3RZP4_ONCTS